MNTAYFLIFEDVYCRRRSFIRDYSYRGYLPSIKQQIADMAVNGSGIRDPARVLKISPTTVIEELKKTSTIAACEQNASLHNLILNHLR